MIPMLAVGVVGPLVHAPARADETSDDRAGSARTEEMVVRAARTPDIRSTLPVSTTVLDGERLDDSISVTLADTLRFVPSLQLTQEGARGGRAQLSLRGLDPNHVVVLIDGLRLNDPMNSRGGAFDPTTLALVDIERVEILRGPLSTVHGSDALAGAIDIVTRRARPDDPPESSVRVRGGRFHTGNAIAQARTGLGGVAGLTLGAAYDTFRDPNSDGGYDGANLKARLDVPLPFALDFGAFTRLHQGSARSLPESSGGSELAFPGQGHEDRDVREILFGLTLSRPISTLGEVELRVGRTSRRERVRSPGIDASSFLEVPATRSGDDYRRWDVTLASTLDAPRYALAGVPVDTRVVVGTDVVVEDGESDATLAFSAAPPGLVLPGSFQDERRTIGVFGELEKTLADTVSVSASLRYDTTPDENDRLIPAAGLSIAIPRTPLTAFGHYSEGYKRPSFYALGNPLVGRPDLRSEKSRGWEAGLRGRFLDGRFGAQLVYFELLVKDLIDFDDATFSLANRRRLVSRGVELELDWRPCETLGLRAGGSWNGTRFAGEPGTPPLNRPEWRGFLSLDVRPVDSVELSARLLGVGSVKASSFRTLGRVDTLSGYARVDVRAAWRPRDWLDLFVEVENLTNATPREAVGFESPGIAPRAGFTLRL